MTHHCEKSWYRTESENLLWHRILQSLKFCRDERLVMNYVLSCQRHFAMLCSEPRFGLFSVILQNVDSCFYCSFEDLGFNWLV